MLETIAVILIILWLLGMVSGYTLGNFIYVLLVVAIVLFLVPVTLIMHAFWADNDPMQRQANIVNFSKNVGLLGSSLMFLAVPRPWPYSVERRLRLPVRAPV